MLALQRQTPGMSDEDREAVNRSMRRLVEKLLHTPTVQAKKLSAAGQSVSYPDALAALFNLPTGMTQQVSAVKGANAGSGQRKQQKPQENRVSTARAVYRSTYQDLTQASTPGGKDDDR